MGSASISPEDVARHDSAVAIIQELYRASPECAARSCDIRVYERHDAPVLDFSHPGDNGQSYTFDRFAAIAQPEEVHGKFREYARSCHERIDATARTPLTSSASPDSMVYAGTPGMVPTPQHWDKARLGPVPCAMCGKPVAWQDHKTDKSLAGGKCLSDTCRPGKNGRTRDVYTFVRIVHAIDL